MQDYRKLHAWSDAHRLVLEVYRVTREFPPEERFGLTSQLRRAAASIPTNVAEGSKRRPGDFARFLSMAQGSAAELEYLLQLAEDLRLLPPDVAGVLRAEAGRIGGMLYSLRRRVDAGCDSMLRRSPA